jgi:hypothetical protein
MNEEQMLDQVEEVIKSTHNQVNSEDRTLARGILCGLKIKDKELIKRKINLVMIIDFLNKKWLPKTFPNSYIKDWFEKNSTRRFILIFFILVISSCKKDELTYPYPCLNGNCGAEFWVETPSTAKKDANGYWHVPFWGPNYFSITGKLDELVSYYVVNGVPLIETSFDSDYWVIFDTIQYRYPVYSHLGLYRDRRFQDPIPIGTRTYTMVDIAKLQPPLNIVGYQISKHFCFTCPYAPTLMGVNSSYNYNPKCNIFYNQAMIGDTANILIEVKFNSDWGTRVTRQYTIPVIFDPR